MRLLSTLLILLALTIPAFAAPEVGINSMLVGDKILQVTDTRQLTLRADGNVTLSNISPDGKYVVYMIEKPGASELRLARTSTGRTIKIMDAGDLPSEDVPLERRPPSGEMWAACLPIAWSPDSTLFAFQATRRTWSQGKQSDETFVVVYTAAGIFKKALPIQKSQSDGDEVAGVGIIPDRLLFTPDSQKLVVTLAIFHKTDPNANYWFSNSSRAIATIDIATSKLQGINYKIPNAAVVGWSSDGSLLLAGHPGGKIELHKVALDGSSDQVIADKCAHEVMTSADGMLAASDRPSLTVKNQLTGKQIDLAKDVKSFLAWAPNSRMLFYSKSESIVDPVAKDRKRDFRSLWLSTVQPGKLNHMCIALDSENQPSSSHDCHRIAYVSQGQLYVAELSLRDPTVGEKLVAGIPLTEDETKQVLLNNAKQIGAGMRMYMADNNDEFPPGNSITSALHDYLRTPDVFCRPGTQDNVFKYVDPGVRSEGEIATSSETVLGELDAGYSWKVQLYADGHVEVKAK